MGIWRRIRVEPSRIAVVAVGGLLIAITIVGLVGLELNQKIRDVVETSLSYDIELEDIGYDLTTATVRLRQAHRTLDLEGTAPDKVSSFEDSYHALLAAIDRLDALGVREGAVPRPELLRSLANSYHTTFTPAFPLYPTDLLGYERISDRSLAVLEELDREIQPIDKVGEQHFREGLGSVADATASARWVLLWVVIGVALVALMLAFAVVRMVGDLRGLYARERATAEARSGFLADVAHELRTPLTVLRTNADVGLSLNRDGPLLPLFQEIVGESQRMERMLQDLLLLASSESTQLPLDQEPVEVTSFLGELAVRAQSLALDSGATVDVHIAAEGEVHIDRPRIEQVALILVDNAVKYSPPRAAITLAATTGSDELTIQVADRGFGIPDDELPYVFERFYRADRSKPRVRKVDGAGLGLSIARTIVEAHGGRISAARRPGGGTCVEVHLPLIKGTSRRVDSAVWATG